MRFGQTGASDLKPTPAGSDPRLGVLQRLAVDVEHGGAGALAVRHRHEGPLAEGHGQRRLRPVKARVRGPTDLGHNTRAHTHIHTHSMVRHGKATATAHRPISKTNITVKWKKSAVFFSLSLCFP